MEHKKDLIKSIITYLSNELGSDCEEYFELEKNERAKRPKKVCKPRKKAVVLSDEEFNEKYKALINDLKNEPNTSYTKLGIRNKVSDGVITKVKNRLIKAGEMNPRKKPKTI